MDDWVDEPGAWVEGHRGVVQVRGVAAQASCGCGHPFGAQPSVQAACLALLQHLQAAVRAGAQVMSGGDGDGLAGVREPRRPVPSHGSGGRELDIA